MNKEVINPECSRLDLTQVYDALKTVIFFPTVINKFQSKIRNVSFKKNFHACNSNHSQKIFFFFFFKGVESTLWICICFPNDPLKNKLISEFIFFLLMFILKHSLYFIVTFIEVSSVLYEFTTLSRFWPKHWASG